jgi:hypothetical protein
MITTYGVGKPDQQDRQSISQMCEDAGLVLVTESVGEDGFYLRFNKKKRCG